MSAIAGGRIAAIGDVGRVRRRGDRLPGPACAAGRDRQPRAFPRARPDPQGGPGNRLARRRAGRRHGGVRDAEHRAAHHQRRGAGRQGPRAHHRMHCDFAFYVGATRENTHELGELERLPGACGVKVFMGSSTGSLLIEDDEGVRNVLKAIRRRAAFHSEDEYRLRERMHLRVEGDPRSHPVWRDATAALMCTQRLIRLARETGKRVHVLHITTKEEIAFPRRAQGRRHRRGDALASDARRARLLRAARHAGPAQSAGARRLASRRHLARAWRRASSTASAPTIPRTPARKRRIPIRRPIPA